jgi:hypothetical protein
LWICSLMSCLEETILLLNQTIDYLKKLWEIFGMDIPKLQNLHTHTIEPRKYKLTHINDGRKYTKKHILLRENWTLPLGLFLLQQYWFKPTTPPHPKYTYCTQPTSIKYKNQNWMTHSQLLEGLKCDSKWKIVEEGGVGMRSLAHNTLRGRGACWSSGMGLGRIDKLIHSHEPAHNPHKVVSA